MTALGRLRRLLSLWLRETIDALPAARASLPVLPSIHNSSSSLPLSSLFLPLLFLLLSPQSISQGILLFISLNLHHDVQKRSAAIQPRRGRCLCHWPDRFGEFSSSLFPSHPVLRVPIPAYIPPIPIPPKTHHQCFEYIDIYCVFTQWIIIMPLTSLFTSLFILPGRS